MTNFRLSLLRSKRSIYVEYCVMRTGKVDSHFLMSVFVSLDVFGRRFLSTLCYKIILFRKSSQ